MAKRYDSRRDTLEHIGQVRLLIRDVINDLRGRALLHDRSKLSRHEKPAFDKYTPKLRATTYGSPQYKRLLNGLGVALRHHYEANDHHPEHFPNGIAEMDLLQLIEMLADWKAATLRHDDGDLSRSIDLNAERFGYGPELAGRLRLTAERLGWL